MVSAEMEGLRWVEDNAHADEDLVKRLQTEAGRGRRGYEVPPV